MNQHDGLKMQERKEKGQEEITRLIHGRLAELKATNEKTPGFRDRDGFAWNDLIEPSDSADQWKGGGDCNKCRRLSYCKKKCRANRLLKEITTPFLYQLYVDEHPEVAAEDAAKSITPEDMLKLAGIDEGKLLS